MVLQEKVTFSFLQRIGELRPAAGLPAPQNNLMKVENLNALFNVYALLQNNCLVLYVFQYGTKKLQKFLIQF